MEYDEAGYTPEEHIDRVIGHIGPVSLLSWSLVDPIEKVWPMVKWSKCCVNLKER